MILAAALALLLATEPEPASTAATSSAAAEVSDRDANVVEWDFEAFRVRVHVVLYELRPGARATAAEAARAVLAVESEEFGGGPIAVLVLDRARRRAGVASSPAVPEQSEVRALLRRTLRDVELELARGTFDDHREDTIGALGRVVHALDPNGGVLPPAGAPVGGRQPDAVPPGPAGAAGAPDLPATDSLPPDLDPPEEPFEPLWWTGPGWLVGLVAALTALLVWATGTPVVRGRDWTLAMLRLLLTTSLAFVGCWLLLGGRVALEVATAVGVALLVARAALGPARRREDARAPGPVGWLGDLVFQLASALLVMAVQLVVEILINALLEAIFGGGSGGGDASWGGGGGTFSGGGASGSW